MPLHLRAMLQRTEVRTLSDVRLGWLADVEFDAEKWAVQAIGVSSIRRLSVSLQWIPRSSIRSWTNECIRVDDATVSYAATHEAINRSRPLAAGASSYVRT